ncbi:MAG: BtpA/SgcQ family protein [Phycisphaerales bacterium]|nr:BtpA/SgcQ family protein [Phycisphaerales bacterium]
MTTPTRNSIFHRSHAIIGMVHVDALPGAPASARAVREIAARALAEARLLHEAGFDGLILENMHDRPYINAPHGPQTTAAMTAIACRIRDAMDLVMGIQILSRGEREALGVALACDAQFIRCENFVYAHIADEGFLPDAAAGPLLRYRREIVAEHIKVFCDIKKKHASHAITTDITLTDAAHTAEFFGADGLIVTGAFTGSPTDPADLQQVRQATTLPVLVGSGVTSDQVPGLFRHADALIVGSSIKHDGIWSNPIDPARCRTLIQAADSARGNTSSRA